MSKYRPELCDFPALPLWGVTAGDVWGCPNCHTIYRLTRPIPRRPWRNWHAPHGYWKQIRWPSRWQRTKATLIWEAQR